jgi:hypothetical protein
MKTWYQCTVKYTKENDQGHTKIVTEKYVCDALSFTEAEAKIYDEIGQRVMGEFQVTAITKTQITEIFEYDDADQFYQAKVCYSAVDIDSGKEKKITNVMLVTAHSVDEAHNRVKESLNNMLVTFTVPEVKESPILEVFHHIQGGNNE